jgi:hypothetical protein
MHAFTVHPQKPPEPAAPPAADEKPPRRRRRWLVALLLFLLIGGLGWAVRSPSHLARAQELQRELFEAKNLPPEERKARFEAFRSEVKQLTEGQKRELFAPMREKRKAEMNRYFAMSPREKTKYLDDLIDRSEKMKKEWEQKGKANGGGPGGGPGGGFGFGPGGGGGGKASTPQEKETRRKQALDNTSPEERAQRDQFRRDLDNRRRQRGLSVTPR